MKKLNIKISLLTLFVLGAFSCEDFLGDENVDPNKPISVSVTGQLASTQIHLVDVSNGAFSRFNCMFMQQVEGVARQWDSFNDYVLTANRFDSPWTFIYENTLVELRTIRAQATENGYNHYLAVANIMEALTMLTATDVWGDIPFEEAGLGFENFNPVFDDQATVIYPAIISMLNEAIALFGQTAGDVVPGAEDVFYGGDIDLWTKAANAILARAYLHQGNYTQALAAAQASFEDATENMAYTYPDAADGSNWYRFNIGRTGDIEFHPNMRTLMTGLNDTTRLARWDVTFDGDHPYLVATYRHDLISYRELQFIIAETAFRTGAGDDVVRNAYLAGIEASFDEAGVPEGYADYVSQATVDPGAGNITLEQIMTQKYIGLFVQPEVFSDWRRTGIPALSPTSGTQIPRRWDYSFNEYLFNSNAPEQDAGILFERVDWDTN